jgi:glycosyltransferase involved in cell wall biosynthesis
VADPDLISVVVPTRNEAAHVASFLEGIPPQVELVVADAGDDGTDALFQKLRPARTTVVRSHGGIPTARNIGARAAHGQWLVFTDADIRFEAGYFDRLAQGVAGHAFYGPKHTTTSYARYSRAFSAAQRALHAAGIPAASGSNMGVRREVFEEVGGFREDLRVNEDTELMMRVKRRGFRVDWRGDLGVSSIDDRRLDDGLLFKSAHSLSRGLLLWLSFRLPVPQRWLQHDWGYWRPRRPGSRVTRQEPD